MSERPTAGPARGRAQASASIWRWQDGTEERGRAASSQRRAGLVRGLVGLAFGGLLFYFDRPVVAAVAWTISGLTVVLAMVSPLGAYAMLDRAVARLGRGVGLVLTWLLLAPAYYLVLTPLALVIRLRRDPLTRTIERDRKSYWNARQSRPLDRPY